MKRIEIKVNEADLLGLAQRIAHFREARGRNNDSKAAYYDSCITRELKLFFSTYRPRGFFYRFLDLVSTIAVGIATNGAQLAEMRKQLTTIMEAQNSMSDILANLKAASARIAQLIANVIAVVGNVGADVTSITNSQTAIANDLAKISADIKAIATKLGQPGGIPEVEISQVTDGLNAVGDQLGDVATNLQTNATALDAATTTLSESTAALDGTVSQLDGLAATVPLPDPKPVLTLTGITPDTLPEGAPSFALHLDGTGFTESSKIFFAGGELGVSFVSSNRIDTDVPNLNMPPGMYDVQVQTPSEIGVDLSNALHFTVTVAEVIPGSFS